MRAVLPDRGDPACTWPLAAGLEGETTDLMRLSFSIALLVSLAVSACMREDGRAAPGSNPPAQQEKAPAAEQKQMSAAEAAAALPGFPVEGLPPYLRQTLVQAAEDEFVFDGSPYTLAGCVREDKP